MDTELSTGYLLGFLQQVEERLDALESLVDALIIEAAGCESEKQEFGALLKRRAMLIAAKR